MKPRYRPGKAVTSGRAARARIAKSKPLTQSQMAHLRAEMTPDMADPKEGRKGEKAHWNTDYEEGCLFDQKPMPYKDSESVAQNGIRRFRRNSR